MTLKEIYSKNSKTNNKNILVLSFEVFPPKNDEDGEKLNKLINHLSILQKYNPTFVSLTYGAGGTTQSSSFEIIKRIQSELDLNIMPHFTCVCTKKNNIREYLNEIQKLGIKNILALKGDIPEGVCYSDFDFHYANELVEFIKSETNLSIGVAGYPEGHIDCEDFSVDLKNLKRKVDAGADAIYTQLFFDNDKFYNFVEQSQNEGINVPIIPGILPISSYNQLERMLSMARVTVPNELMEKLEKFKNNPDDVKKIGIDFASKQCQNLIDANIAGMHFYTLNTSDSVSKILDNLSIHQFVS